jgi:hypothetical protein
MTNMNRRIHKLGVALAIAGCAMGGVGQAQQDNQLSPAVESVALTPFWPNRFHQGEDAFTVYPPQFERWERDHLEGRAAVAVQPEGAERPIFGVVSLSARTEVDAGTGIVVVRKFEVAAGDFPTAPDRAGSYLDAVRRHLEALTWRVELARLQADLAIDQAAERAGSQPLRNEPPRIVFVQSPAILVPIDGEPVLQPFGEAGLLRVVNTRALILRDRTTDRYFLYVAGYWLEAAALAGPWTQARVRPMALDEARTKALAEDLVDVLEDEEPAGSRAPKVIVSTGPTELVQTDGPPQYAPIGQTDLLFVTNSPNRLFLDLRTQVHYVLLAGRWYRASSLARGVWTYVPGSELPADFAMIPEEHPTGSVRAAVAGTPQAQEAVIANGVPEIAAVKRSAARLEISYDGTPQFRPIEGTGLEAAVNAPVPVIRVDSRTYYALDNGVWFFSESAHGPWIAATFVPAAIYAIPRSDPLHYVTYVRVYDATPEDIYVGYTPGYVGSYVTVERTVVYGTGWYYRPWIGTVWYAPPATWGFGFSFYHSWWNPWPVRAWWPAWRPVPCFRPAWGPWPRYHAGVKHPGMNNGVVILPGAIRPHHGRPDFAGDSRRHDRRAFHGKSAGAGDIYGRWDGRSISRHRSDVPRDARPGVRPGGGTARFVPPGPRQHDQPRVERDDKRRAWDGRRPGADSPRWFRPDDPANARDHANARGQTNTRDQANTRDRGNARDRAPKAHSAPRPGAPSAQGGIPGRPPATARTPQVPDGRPSAANPGMTRPHQFDGGRRFDARRPSRPEGLDRTDRPRAAVGDRDRSTGSSPRRERRWERRDDGPPPAASAPQPGTPRGMQPGPRGFTGSPRPPGADRQLGAPRHNGAPRDAQPQVRRDANPTPPPGGTRPGAGPGRRNL